MSLRAVHRFIERLDRDPAALAAFQADGAEAMRHAGLMDDVTSHVELRSFSPIFPVRDLRRALDHYAALGFEVRPYAEGDFYGFADRDGAGLHLSSEHEHDGDF